MSIEYIDGHAELYFRTYINVVFPLHAALIEMLCKAPRVPQELATVLEDVGQGYCRLADEVNAELIRRGEMTGDPDADSTEEARVDAFLAEIMGTLGHVELLEGQIVDARRALAEHPVVADSIKVALRLAAPINSMRRPLQSGTSSATAHSASVR